MLRKAIHIILACFILISTTGFTITLHYCHNEIYTLPLFAPAHSSCETATLGHCPSTGEPASINHREDESIVVESTGDYVGSSFEVRIENTHSIDLLFTESILFNAELSDDDVVYDALPACCMYERI